MDQPFNSLEDVYTEWENNVAFRAAFTKDPDTALKEAGMSLSPEDLAKIKSMLHIKRQHKGADEELDKKINK